MKRFVAYLNDGNYINAPADRMESTDGGIFVYNGQELVAYMDLSCVLTAYLSEKVQ